MVSLNRKRDRLRGYDQGFSLVEVLIVLVILSIVTTLALMGITQARASLQLANNGDILKAYIERAFTDAKRRHALGDQRAKIEVISDSAYRVTIDLNADGKIETQTIPLTDRVKFIYDAASPPRATIDWRGNVAEGQVLFKMRSYRGETLGLDLTGTGDSSIDTGMPVMPSITVTTSSADVNSGATVIGNTAPNPNPSPTPSPTPLPICTGAQKPGANDCRCQAGKTIDDKGKCH